MVYKNTESHNCANFIVKNTLNILVHIAILIQWLFAVVFVKKVKKDCSSDSAVLQGNVQLLQDNMSCHRDDIG